MSRKLWIVPISLLLSGAGTLFADTLVMQDGRRIRGELVSVSVSQGTVVFDQERGDLTRARRTRVRLADVARINFNDRDVIEDSDSDSDFGLPQDDIFGSGNLSRERAVNVRADRRWIDTGIDVRAGQTVQFDPQGVVSWGPGRQDGPDGEPNSPYNASRPIPDRPGAALIGRIGNSNDVFFIGNDRGAFRVRNSGRLYLGINDDHIQDNSGAFQVRIHY